MKRFLILVFVSLYTALSAQSVSERIKHFNVQEGLAIEGYDPVAYFVNNKAVKGMGKYSAKYAGLSYYFSSQKNKDIFLKDPAYYEPQYGGWCAFAMGENGKKVAVNPETFKLTGGKLYLFYNAYFNNTLKSWNKNENALREKANQNWQSLLKK